MPLRSPSKGHRGKKTVFRLEPGSFPGDVPRWETGKGGLERQSRCVRSKDGQGFLEKRKKTKKKKKQHPGTYNEKPPPALLEKKLKREGKGERKKGSGGGGKKNQCQRRLWGRCNVPEGGQRTGEGLKKKKKNTSRSNMHQKGTLGP